MPQSETLLHCTNCNQKTSHRRLSTEEIEENQRKRNSWKARLLSIVADVIFGTHKSPTMVSYYKCTVCGAEYNEDESMPHGWG
ncbi:hypothetical protein NM22_02130 [Vibrio tubiashii]|nr:hypothetical protein NM22_02130 [Vibrio tubiashii]